MCVSDKTSVIQMDGVEYSSLVAMCRVVYEAMPE